MGEEKKEEVKQEEKKEQTPEEKKEEEKKEEEPQEIVLRVDMHCEGCARKVARTLKGFEGVEEVTTDSKASKVVVKGKAANPVKVSERLQKKSGRKVELISPLPKPPEEPKQEEKKEEAPKEEEKKEEPPQPVTVVLSIRMHCEACAQVLQKRIKKIKGVDSVETDVANDKVTVKGLLDPEKLASDVYKKTRKQASVVPEEKKEEKKEEEKKEEEEEKKKEESEEAKEEDDDKMDMKQVEHWAAVEYPHYPPPEMFSDDNPNACSLM